eukprot:Clim_evm9s245 gene=Clim_evmTU9s245
MPAKTIQDYQHDLPTELSHLKNKGYQVIPGVITNAEALKAREEIFEWFEGLNIGFDRKDPQTWQFPKSPSTVAGILLRPNGSFIAPVVRIRTHANVAEQFSKVWGTDDLVVSYDRINVTPPPEIDPNDDGSPDQPWFHTDQDKDKRGRHCVQGMIPLNDMHSHDATLHVLEGSHAYHAEFFEQFRPNHKAQDKDFHRFTDEEVEWFESRPGVRRVRVSANRGDLVLWDSRTVHCSAKAQTELRPSRKDPSDLWRFVVYVCMGPAALVTDEDRRLRRMAFETDQATSHWPYGVRVFPEPANPEHWTLRKPAMPDTELGKRLMRPIGGE